MAKKQTYANRAKSIMNKYKPRLGEKFDKGDTLALEAMNQELTALQQEQEQARLAEQEAQVALEEGAIETFQNGGKLNRKQQQTLSTILANRNTPFVNNALQGRPANFQVGVNAVGQPSVTGKTFPGSEPPVSGPQILGEQGIQQNAIPFGDQRSARQFARRAPKAISKAQKMGLLEVPPRNPRQFGKGGGLPTYQDGGDVQPWTADMYRQAAMNAPQYPSGQPAYPYGQYFGDVMRDNMAQMGNIGTSQYGGFRSPHPNDLIAGRSPLFPWEHQQQQRPAYPAGSSRGGTPNSTLGSFQGIADPLFPKVKGDEPLSTQGGLEDFGGVSAADKLGLTIRGGAGGTGGGTKSAAAVGPGNIGIGNIDYGNMMGQQMPFNPGVYDQMPSNSQAAMQAAQSQNQTQSLATQGGDPYQFRAPWWGAAATGLGSILGNRQLDLPNFENVQDLRAQEVMPNLVDYRRGREQTMRERDLNQAMVRRAAKGRGSQQGVTQSTIAGATSAQRVAGTDFNKSLEGEQNENARIKNQASQFNAAQRARTGETNLRSALMRGQYERENALINAQRRTNQIAGVTGAITGYGRDRMAADKMSWMAQMQAPENYQFNIGKDSGWRKAFGISPTGVYDPVNMNQYMNLIGG